MISKAESQNLKSEFWIAFAKYHPQKWILYNTKIKDFSFKFFVDHSKIQVVLDIEMKNNELRKIYFEKIESLHTILKSEYLPDVVLERNFYLENGKLVSRAWVEKAGLSINNRENWNTIFDFFVQNMGQMELFFEEYQYYISDLTLNT